VGCSLRYLFLPQIEYSQDAATIQKTQQGRGGDTNLFEEEITNFLSTQWSTRRTYQESIHNTLIGTFATIQLIESTT
jgi:hypothetical protein